MFLKKSLWYGFVFILSSEDLRLIGSSGEGYFQGLNFDL